MGDYITGSVTGVLEEDTWISDYSSFVSSIRTRAFWASDLGFGFRCF